MFASAHFETCTLASAPCRKDSVTLPACKKTGWRESKLVPELVYVERFPQ